MILDHPLPLIVIEQIQSIMLQNILCFIKQYCNVINLKKYTYGYWI